MFGLSRLGGMTDVSCFPVTFWSVQDETIWLACVWQGWQTWRVSMNINSHKSFGKLGKSILLWHSVTISLFQHPNWTFRLLTSRTFINRNFCWALCWALVDLCFYFWSGPPDSLKVKGVTANCGSFSLPFVGNIGNMQFLVWQICRS